MIDILVYTHHIIQAYKLIDWPYGNIAMKASKLELEGGINSDLCH